MKRNTILSVIALLLILLFAAYLESPYSFLNKDFTYSADQPVIAQPIDVESTDIPEIEDKLEKTEKVDGYIVETYEEYEVYKDKDGNEIKREPTGKTETLKYWDYSDEDR